MTFPSDNLEASQAPDQGTSEWLEWRRQGIGGSDVAALLGVSPWMTPRELWMEKTGRLTRDASSFATQRGQWLESKARAQYELLADADMPPALVIHPEYPFMRVSLDGWNPELRRVLEIKCPGKEDHAKALAGQIPEKYRYQVQYQMFVTGAESAHYFSFDGESGTIIEVLPNLDLQLGLRNAVIEFWRDYVLKDKEPAPIAREWVHITDEAAIQLFSDFRRVLVSLAELEKQEKEYREIILAKYGNLHPRLKCAGVELLRTKRKGAVDWASIPQLEGVDLEQYRKEQDESFTIKLSKQ